MKERAERILWFLVLVVLMYQPLFGHLDSIPIQLWDESRVAVNSVEMLESGSYIVTTYEGKPEMCNTKPPLLIWFQVLSMKIFGVGELAVRLPSAIAGLLTCISLVFFSVRYLKNYRLGWIAVLVLITSQGFVSLHLTRTGDYDALLTLFTTVAGLLFFAFCETKRLKYLYYFFLMMALAVLTKGIVGFMFVPAFFIYTLIRKQLVNLLKNEHFYFGLIGLLVVVFGYYGLREMLNPGYIEAVYMNELGGRYLKVIEFHDHGFTYYLDNLWDSRYTYWLPIALCGTVAGLSMRNEKINRLTQFLALMVICFLLIISSAQTKLEWYDVPLFPFLAMLSAIIGCFIFDLSRNSRLNEQFRYSAFPFLFLFFLGVLPMSEIIEQTYKPSLGENKEFYELSYFLQSGLEGRRELNGSLVLYDGYDAHIRFYIEGMKQEGIFISFAQKESLLSGDHVVAQQKQIKEYIQGHYEHVVLSSEGSVMEYRIINPKD